MEKERLQKILAGLSIATLLSGGGVVSSARAASGWGAWGGRSSAGSTQKTAPSGVAAETGTEVKEPEKKQAVEQTKEKGPEQAAPAAAEPEKKPAEGSTK